MSFWDGLFSKAMLVSGRVYAPRGILTLHILIPTTLPSSRTQQVTPPGYRTKDALETEILRINPWRLREGPKRRIQTSQRSPTTFFGSTGRAMVFSTGEWYLTWCFWHLGFLIFCFIHKYPRDIGLI